MKTHASLFLVMLAGLLRAVPLPDEARVCYDWFATLGFPEVKDAEWAEVKQTFDSLNGDEGGTRKMHGFILDDEDNHFSVLLPDLTVKRMQRGVSNTEFEIRGTFEERDFGAWAAEQLKALKNPSKDGFRRFGAHLGHKTETFALSYFCWRRGESDLAAQLYAEAEKLTAWHSSWQSPKPTKPMRETIEI